MVVARYPKGVVFGVNQEEVPLIMDITPLEAERRAESTKTLLEDMRAGIQTHAWWNRPFDELAGRTPTEALEAGDEQAIMELIDYWYRRSEESAEQVRSDPEFMEMLERRSKELRALRSA
jgi:PAS domain-containing protein